MAAVRERLSCYPSLSAVRRGSALAYAIDDCGGERFYLVSFSRSGIALELYSRESPLYFMREALLRLLSLAAVLSGEYEFDVRTLFPYLIEALRPGAPEIPVRSLGLPRARVGGETILAGRISRLNRENARLALELNAARAAATRTTALFLISRYGTSVEIGRAARESGLAVEAIEAAVRAMPELGYRALRLGAGRFSLVRA